METQTQAARMSAAMNRAWTLRVRAYYSMPGAGPDEAKQHAFLLNSARHLEQFAEAIEMSMSPEARADALAKVYAGLEPIR